jgi:hypothetical protein
MVSKDTLFGRRSSPRAMGAEGSRWMGGLELCTGRGAEKAYT